MSMAKIIRSTGEELSEVFDHKIRVIKVLYRSLMLHYLYLYTAIALLLSYSLDCWTFD